MKTIISFVTIFFILTFPLSCQNQEGNFICPPCDMECDKLTFEKDGSCPHCNMNLIMNVKSSAINEIKIKEGDGNFLIEGGVGHQEKTIKVFYHRPSTFDTTSNVLIVLPGAGRNANDYRDAWVKASEKHNILVLSPEYSERYYPQFWNYNLAGMLTDVRINTERTAMIDFKINDNSNDWIYSDFDRIFDLVKNELYLTNKHYDC